MFVLIPAQLDYIALSEVITFSDLITVGGVFPSFQFDDLVEQDEFFTLRLGFVEENNLNVRLIPDEVTVIIEDNDGKLIIVSYDCNETIDLFLHLA